jgi:hypothetical protein
MIDNITVVSCMHLRFVPKIIQNINDMGYEGKYDFLSVAGSSLCVCNPLKS